ncbi:MAG: hypothetical protein M3N12_10340, partial [Verrucomicrobiota bacterium]|nr:hypothetical protein [Verrucomicrobiota bacterium]
LSLVLLLGGAVIARGQESPTPTPNPKPTPAERNVRISFLPPPLDGTISLGIYNAQGKLVRVLHREADINEFDIGTDALSTTWDGKDDAGENVPPGKYSAHGFVVGDLGIEGVGFSFNDWITADDSPRISRIRSLALKDADLLLGAELTDEETGHLRYNIAEKTTKLIDTDELETPPSPAPIEAIPNSVDPIAVAPGRNGTRWVIDRTAKGAVTTELKQFSSSGEFLRSLTVPASEPQPTAIAASMTEDMIYLLEENSTAQRVRGLTLLATKAEGGVSDWKVDFEKRIVAHKNFALADGKPVATSPSGASVPEKVKIKLQANPLLNDDRVTVEVAVGFDEDGSFLKSDDGLPLCSVSETTGLIRGLVMSNGANALDVFQDDGAVVEQFRVTGVDQMMSFDCGGFELK